MASQTRQAGFAGVEALTSGRGGVVTSGSWPYPYPQFGAGPAGGGAPGSRLAEFGSAPRLGPRRQSRTV